MVASTALPRNTRRHTFVSVNDIGTPNGRWTAGPSIDGKGEFYVVKAAPLGGEPKLAPPVPEGHAQKEQMTLPDSIMGNIKHAGHLNIE